MHESLPDKLNAHLGLFFFLGRLKKGLVCMPNENLI